MKELQEERKTLECLGQGRTHGQEGGPARLLLSTSTMSVVDPDTVDFKDNPCDRGRQKKQPRLTSQSGRDMRGISDAARSAEDETLNYVKFPFIIRIQIVVCL